MNTMKCKQDIYYLHGLYVYLTHVYICLHEGTKVDYLPALFSTNAHFFKTSEEFLRQIHKTTKSHLLVDFTYLHTFANRPCVFRDISRVDNEL